jgi:hypothetical protein
MKRFAILCAITMAFASQALAFDGNYYAELESYFTHAGTLPEVSRVEGWNIGRCYWRQWPSTAAPSVLVGLMEQNGTENGPLFPPGQSLKFVPIYMAPGAYSADFYDHMTPEQQARVASSVEASRDVVTAPVIGKRSMLETLGGQVRWELRSYQNYLILSFFGPRNQIGYCYYFDQLH